MEKTIAATKIEVRDLQRVFIYNKDGIDVELEDPNPKLAKDKVLLYWADTYPELNNATVKGPTIKNDQLQYEFISLLGTKG